MSKHDRESNMRGMELAIRALVAAGAEWVSPANVGPSDLYKPASGSSEALEEYIGRIRSQGIVANQTQVRSNHIARSLPPAFPEICICWRRLTEPVSFLGRLYWAVAFLS